MNRISSPGAGVIQLLGLILVSLMISALSIDIGYYFAAQNGLQTAADSASLAAVSELYRNIDVDPKLKIADAKNAAQDFLDRNETGLKLVGDDVVFGFVDPASKIYDSDNFRQPTANPNYALTSGYNAIYIKVGRGTGSSNSPLKTIMANLFGISSMDTAAESVALIDQTVNGITDGGVRPIYACQAQFDRTMQDGIPENNVVRIYGDHIEVDGVQNQTGCPSMGSGNWGFADL
jgi:Flp pilus assembly protein TadG